MTNMLPLVLGGLPFGTTLDETESLNFLDYAHDLGIRNVDLGTLYGNGKAISLLAKYNKTNCNKQFRLNVKAGLRKLDRPDGTFGVDVHDMNYKYVIESAQKIRKDIGCDQISCYTFHAFSSMTPIKEQLEAVTYLLESDVIETYGISNFNSFQLQIWLDTCIKEKYPLPSSLDANFNLLEQRARYELMPILDKYDVLLTPYRALCRGMLAGRYSTTTPPAGSRASSSWRIRSYLNEGNIDLIAKLTDYVEMSLGMSLLHFSLSWLLSFRSISKVCIGTSSRLQLQQIVESFSGLGKVDVNFIDNLLDHELIKQIRHQPETFFET